MEGKSNVNNSFINKLRNIDGKVLGKDGKPMKLAKRGVSFDDKPQQQEDESGTAGVSKSEKPVKEKESYASVVQSNQSTASVSVRVQEMHNQECVAGAHVVLPMAAVEEIQSRFKFTLYGYFIGKRMAFPLVENYVKNTWGKYGLQRTMLDGEFFLFQFESEEGMDRVLAGGPWLIKLAPIILNVWTPNTVLKKEMIKSAPVWLKLYNVPIVAYSETGLSLITSQVGKPVMLDSYTSSMCVKSWGKKEYARVLTEISAENEVMQNVVIAIPLGEGEGHSLATVEVELEWKPPRCAECKIFDHVTDKCPKKVGNVQAIQKENNGFVLVKREKKRIKHKPSIEGIRLSKPKPNFVYRQVGPGSSSNNQDAGKLKNGIHLHNSFTGFDGIDPDDNTLNGSDNDEAEEILKENMNIDGKGESTPNDEVSNV